MGSVRAVHHRIAQISATIASRCQHFQVSLVEFDELIKRIDWICEQEGIEADAEAFAVLAAGR